MAMSVLSRDYEYQFLDSVAVIMYVVFIIY